MSIADVIIEIYNYEPKSIYLTRAKGIPMNILPKWYNLQLMALLHVHHATYTQRI